MLVQIMKNMSVSLLCFWKSWVGQGTTWSWLVTHLHPFIFPLVLQGLSRRTVCGTPSSMGSPGMSRRSHGLQLSTTPGHLRKSLLMNCLSSIARKPWWKRPSGLVDCSSVCSFLFVCAVISVQDLFVFNIPTSNHLWGCDLLNKNLRPFYLKAPWHPITLGSLESWSRSFLL